MSHSSASDHNSEKSNSGLIWIVIGVVLLVFLFSIAVGTSKRGDDGKNSSSKTTENKDFDIIPVELTEWKETVVHIDPCKNFCFIAGETPYAFRNMSSGTFYGKAYEDASDQIAGLGKANRTLFFWGNGSSGKMKIKTWNKK